MSNRTATDYHKITIKIHNAILQNAINAVVTNTEITENELRSRAKGVVTDTKLFVCDLAFNFGVPVTYLRDNFNSNYKTDMYKRAKKPRDKLTQETKRAITKSFNESTNFLKKRIDKLLLV